jgi:uncharacterized repeat protein (TIGR03837 family)
LNFVRGEDSFVRAQWAGKPFVWQIYPQADDVHLKKLDAFLHLFMQKVGDDDTAIDVIRTFWRAWNSEGALNWPAFAATLPALAPATQRWSAALARQTNLASNLVQFCIDRLK